MFFKNNDFLEINRVTNINENENEKEIILSGSNIKISIPETPFSLIKKLADLS